MQRRNGIFNEKRRIREDVTPEELTGLAREISYGGNPEHKRNPGDFGLTPPSQPRADKTLCDAIEVFSRKVATRLLKSGVLKGLISKNERNGFPQNIWSVTDDGCPLEAQLENSELGVYHGYPMPESDSFRKRIIEAWNRK